MKQLKLYAERVYPYIISAMICFALFIKDFNFCNNENLNSLIDGIITMESIVIGLIGAIIPVILSMKNESKFIKYIFEKDTNCLFRKYLTITIGVGLLSIAFSLSMYIKDEYSVNVCKIVYNGWIFLVSLFFLLTYRSMKYMILIIFMNEEDDNDSLQLSQEKKQELRKSKQC